MKVVFGELDEMLSELKEKNVNEVRIEALYDESYDKHGVPFLKLYVTVQALLTPTLYAHHEQVTFWGIKPFKEEEVNQIFKKQRENKEEIKKKISEKGFTIRCGYLKEGGEKGC